MLLPELRLLDAVRFDLEVFLPDLFVEGLHPQGNLFVLVFEFQLVLCDLRQLLHESDHLLLGLRDMLPVTDSLLFVLLRPRPLLFVLFVGGDRLAVNHNLFVFAVLFIIKADGYPGILFFLIFHLECLQFIASVQVLAVPNPNPTPLIPL